MCVVFLFHFLALVSENPLLTAIKNRVDWKKKVLNTSNLKRTT